jgi:hypothetical protein
MVYESDFYTTRRPYSRPTVTSYSVTVRDTYTDRSVGAGIRLIVQIYQKFEINSISCSCQTTIHVSVEKAEESKVFADCQSVWFPKVQTVYILKLNSLLINVLLTHDHTNVRGRVTMIHHLPHSMKIARTVVVMLLISIFFIKNLN